MNKNAIIGVVVAIAAAAAVYFFVLKGDAGQDCSDKAVQELQTKLQTAATTDAAKFAEAVAKLTADHAEDVAKAESGDKEAACKMTYLLAEAVGVK